MNTLADYIKRVEDIEEAQAELGEDYEGEPVLVEDGWDE